MKVKKIIQKQWSLESKDNLDSIKEKISFNEDATNFSQLHNRKLVFRTIAFTCTVFLIVIVGFITYNSNLFSGVSDSDSPNFSGDSTDPSDPVPDAPEYDSPNDDLVEPDSPSEPGEENYIYKLFMDNVKQNFIASDYVSYLTYEDTIFSSNVLIKEVCEYINNLEKIEISNEMEVYSCKITFNEWLAVLLSDESYIAFQYENIIIHFSTNSVNINESIKNILN